MLENLSMLSFTNFHFPPLLLALSSKIGVNYLQGLHQLYVILI